MERTNDVYERLRPPEPAEDVCSCPSEPPIKLMTIRDVRGFNPIHCLDCNLEVPPERLAIDRRLVEAIASWDMEHGALHALELASGSYEEWAQSRLLDPQSPTNVEARELAVRLSEVRACYAWFFQPQREDERKPRTTCPLCGDPLAAYDGGIFRQLLCERDKIVLPG